ncbi:MAG: hypothetical protein NC548_31410 [Lachnospiraceae bacterium]|nr:hypothetical protein [Bacteroides fragilis]MCM1219013.1 hypothetical protein [Lachnospiraceae bacterium]
MAKEKPATKICKHCKTEIPYGAKVCPQCRKKQGGVLKWVIIGFVVIIIIGAASGGNDSDSQPGQESNVSANVRSENTQDISHDASKDIPDEPDPLEIEEVKESEITIGELKEQAQELKYKDVMRNPENYAGQYFCVTVKISSAENGSLFSGYDRVYRAHTNDDYDLWLGDMIYLLDNRDAESEEYTKILEDDIVQVYGRFDRLVETKNVLNGAKGEEMSLQLLYAELISE